MAENDETIANPERQMVVFNLGAEVYGLDVTAVREIIRVPEITRLPNAPEFVAGVINVRGRLIPVMDLHRRFKIAAAGQTGNSRIVVVNVEGELTGVLVDAVTEVLRVSEQAIEPPSAVATTDDSRYIRGIVNLEERLIILLDANNILSQKEQAALSEAEAAVLATAEA